ncbi:MAG: glycosyltransferase family 39 protein [Chloroflexota bacterium]
MTDSRPKPARMPWLLIGLVTVAGLVVRAIPVLLADFPVNDGGLFLAMTHAIQDAGWALPATVTWNGTDLPFVYPPLAFYGAGALEAMFGADLFATFRWLPLVASTLIVPAVFLLGRAILRSDLGGAMAVLAYALAPASYVWMIQGGGVTRSPGLLLAVLAIWQTVVLVRQPTRRGAVVVGLLAGVTALVHPGAAVFAAISGVLLLILEGRTRSSIVHAAGALGVAALVVLPWVVIVVSRHGVGALTDVPSNGPNPLAALLALFAGRVTGVPFTDPLAILGVALAVLSLIRRKWFLPLWLTASLALSYQYAMIPFGMLIGVLAVDLAALVARGAESGAADHPAAPPWIPTIGVAVLAACLLIEGIASAATVLNPGAPVHALSPERREAQAWVSDNTDPNATFAVITDSQWSGDPDSEWFPLLAGHRSVATVQGSEWLGQAAFYAQVTAHRALQACVYPASVSCVREWLAEWPADYLYLPSGPLHGPNSPSDCCAELRGALAADDQYALLYDGPGASIFVVNDRAGAAR